MAGLNAGLGLETSLQPEEVLLGGNGGMWKNGNNTTGPWTSEDETCRAFDNRMTTMGRYFEVLREVKGYCIRPRLDQEIKNYRIDRILVPTPTLMDAGWTIGPVGVECKVPGTPVGRPNAQMGDYANCLFNIGNGFKIMPSFVFLFHYAPPGGATESMMAQQRLGGIYIIEHNQKLRFWSGQTIADFDWNGDLLKLGAGKNGFARNGNRAGAR